VLHPHQSRFVVLRRRRNVCRRMYRHQEPCWRPMETRLNAVWDGAPAPAIVSRGCGGIVGPSSRDFVPATGCPSHSVEWLRRAPLCSTARPLFAYRMLPVDCDCVPCMPAAAGRDALGVPGRGNHRGMSWYAAGRSCPLGSAFHSVGCAYFQPGCNVRPRTSRWD